MRLVTPSSASPAETVEPRSPWCECAVPLSSILHPLRCRRCRQELHVETLMRMRVNPLALRVHRVALLLRQPLAELVPEHWPTALREPVSRLLLPARRSRA
jgi:hypothetical protein